MTWCPGLQYVGVVWWWLDSINHLGVKLLASCPSADIHSSLVTNQDFGWSHLFIGFGNVLKRKEKIFHMTSGNSLETLKVPDGQNRWIIQQTHIRSRSNTHFNTYKRQKTTHVLLIALKSRQKKNKNTDELAYWVKFYWETLSAEGEGSGSNVVFYFFFTSTSLRTLYNSNMHILAFYCLFLRCSRSGFSCCCCWFK